MLALGRFEAEKMWSLILLAVVTAALADSSSRCNEIEVDGLEDALRQSACTLAWNATEKQEFTSYVERKHGVYSDPDIYFAFAELFELRVSKVWCRTSCENPAREEITWCINIAYRERNVETCVRIGDDQQMIISNSTCEAELINLPSFFSLPTDCEFYGDVGCLGLIDLDWYFQGAYMTCTVETDTCYSKSFTELLTTSTVPRPPKFRVFPDSPLNVLLGDQLVLHVELISPTDRVAIEWQYKDIRHTSFLFEDPFCDKEFEDCRNDTHPNALALQEERIRAYRVTRRILHGCQTHNLYGLECYLIIDNVTVEDRGEYVFNTTTPYPGLPPINEARSVNVSVTILDEEEEATISSGKCSHEQAVIYAIMLAVLLWCFQ